MPEERRPEEKCPEEKRPPEDGFMDLTRAEDQFKVCRQQKVEWVRHVLDNGYVRLVDWMGSDESIVEAARMSTGASFRGWETDFSLLDYLYDQRHSGPFEMAELVVEYQCPIFVERHMVRHRTFSRNELSARYIELPDMFYVPDWNRCQDMQSATNKQGSRSREGDALEETTREAISPDSFQEEQLRARESYERRLAAGMVRELARVNLPLSQYTRVRVKGNLRNWLHFFSLRLEDNAQWEVVEFAKVIYSLVKAIWPRAAALFEEYDLNGGRFSRKELDLLTAMIAPSLSPELVFALAKSNLGGKGGKALRFVRKLYPGFKVILKPETAIQGG